MIGPLPAAGTAGVGRRTRVTRTLNHTSRFLAVGLGLLAAHWPGDLPVVEVACGTGHLLRELALRSVADRTGVDVVLAKLWLAARFVDPGAAYVCADVTDGPAVPDLGQGQVCDLRRVVARQPRLDRHSTS